MLALLHPKYGKQQYGNKNNNVIIIKIIRRRRRIRIFCRAVISLPNNILNFWTTEYDELTVSVHWGNYSRQKTKFVRKVSGHF